MLAAFDNRTCILNLINSISIRSYINIFGKCGEKLLLLVLSQLDQRFKKKKTI